MDRKIFKELKDKKVSILVDNLNPVGKRETYVGFIKEIGDDYIYLEMAGTTSTIKGLYIQQELILSIWIY